MKAFIPHLMIKDLAAIPLQALQDRGIKAILFDVDNTIVPYNAQGLPAATITWFAAAKKMGFFLALLSNNSESRLLPVAETLGIPFVARSKKPTREGAKRAMKLFSVTPQEVALVGDQLITDVLCGNRMGFYTIVVEPLNKKELWITRFNRNFEKLIYRSIAKRAKTENDR